MSESRGLASTGVRGLDDVLSGGLTRKRLYLVEGMPGSGKTTLALQFLMAGAQEGEPVLYVTLSETAEELRAVAESHGWTLDGIEIRELAPTEAALDPDEQNTMFHPSEIELASTTQLILEDVERLRPARVVFDSLSELRLLAGNALRYRRQILALKQFFASRDCTVLLLDDMTATDHDLQMQSIAHGVVLLEQLNPRVRRRTAARAHRQLPGREVSWRLSRLRHQHAAASRCSPVWSPPSIAGAATTPSSRVEIAELDALLGRRYRRGHQHADRRCRRHRQVNRCRAVRRGRGVDEASARRSSSSTKAQPRCCPGAHSWGSISPRR